MFHFSWSLILPTCFQNLVIFKLITKCYYWLLWSLFHSILTYIRSLFIWFRLLFIDSSLTVIAIFKIWLYLLLSTTWENLLPPFLIDLIILRNPHLLILFIFSFWLIFWLYIFWLLNLKIFFPFNFIIFLINTLLNFIIVYSIFMYVWILNHFYSLKFI